MSKISMEYDTVAKKMKVMMDGKEIDNISGVRAFNYGHDEDDEMLFGIDIETHEMDKDNKTWTTKRISASKKGEIKIESCPISQHIANQLFIQK